MMFSTNPTNRKPNFEADRRNARRQTTNKPQPEFADLHQFSNWIDSQLALLEERFVEFETQSSLLRHFNR